MRKPRDYMMVNFSEMKALLLRNENDYEELNSNKLDKNKEFIMKVTKEEDKR